MDNLQILANAPTESYVTLGNTISIFVSELAIFISVIGIMMLWIGNQLNAASKERKDMLSELNKLHSKTQKQVNNLTILIATQKGLTVEEAIKLINETEK